jgi:type IV pilus modification protein PilV
MFNQQKGMTLIEVMVSLLILSIGILGVFQAFPAAVKREGAAKNNSTASYLAQGQIESLLSYAYNDTALSVGTTTTSTASGYQIQTNIRYVNPLDNLNSTTTDLGIKKIKVKVFWGQDVPDQTVEIATLYSQK